MRRFKDILGVFAFILAIAAVIEHDVPWAICASLFANGIWADDAFGWLGVRKKRTAEVVQLRRVPRENESA
jgi:hypothetical protein